MNDNALGYLLRTRIKNGIKEFFHKPSRIIYLIFIVAMIVLTVIGGKSSDSDPDRVLRDISELTAGLNALFIIIFSTTFISGIENGGSFFKMSDVNFLFPSPINKRSILFYALIQQMGTTLFIGIFILFQYSFLHSSYNITVWGLILIFLVYSLVAFIAQSTAMFLYTFISDSDKKVKAVKRIFKLIIIAIILYVGMNVLKDKDNMVPIVVSYGNSLPIQLFPFAGWLGAFTAGIFTGNYAVGFIGFIASVAVFIALLVVVSNSKREYYEDVLDSAENTTQRINSMTDGTPAEQTPRHIKIGKTGLGKGEGASAIFYKHLLENRRSSKLFISTVALIFIAMTIIFAFILKENGLLPIMAFSIYLMIFSMGTQRFAWELQKPYVYLIPEPPLKKIIFTILETLPNIALESIITFIPVTIIVGASPIECLMCIIARISFGALFVAGDIAIERVWGGSLSRIAGFFLYLLCNIILALPGIVLAGVLYANGIAIGSIVITVFLAVTICNIPIAVLVLFLCRNMLTYAEISN